MQDFYQIPVFALTLLLLPGLGYMALRFYDRRTRLWFFAFLLTIVRMAQNYTDLVFWNVSNERLHPWIAAMGDVATQIASIIFVMSFTEEIRWIKRFRIPWGVAYAAPVCSYAIFYYGVLRSGSAHGIAALFLPAMAAMAAITMTYWSLQQDKRGLIPFAIVAPLGTGMSILALVFHFYLGPQWTLMYSECAAHLMAAVLLVCVSRRMSPGVLLTALGFAAWSTIILQAFPAVFVNPLVMPILLRCAVMGKVVVALGLILLALEEQLALNQATSEREHRIRRELESYSALVLTGLRVADLDMQAEKICCVVVENSLFTQAALILQQANGSYHLAGSAGLEYATSVALDAMAARIPASEFLAVAPLYSAVNHAQALQVDFAPWLQPGDDLLRLRFTSALAVPMRGRSSTEGALLLAGQITEKALTADDLLPVEVLAARLQAVRSQTHLHEQLVDAEKFSGLGQLAGNISQQLHNPLTVILGYASLLEDAQQLNPVERKGVEAILSSARSMRATLESLHRVARNPGGGPLTAVSVAELLADMDQLYRPEFLHRSIEFRLRLAPNLPLVICQPQPVRQAVLHSLQYAMTAVESGARNGRSIRLEAAAEGNRVQIMVAHSGTRFEHPERAFDAYPPVHSATGETAGMGLSLCASILRENNGRAFAINLDPHGAAILLELQAEN